MKLSKSQSSILVTIFWLLVIFSLSVMPVGSSPKKISSWFSFQNIDKVGHFISYGILAFLILRTIAYSFWSYFHAIIFTLLVASLYGLSLEIIQGLFLPNRYFEFLDILANIMGSLMGVVSHVAFFQTVKPRI